MGCGAFLMRIQYRITYISNESIAQDDLPFNKYDLKSY